MVNKKINFTSRTHFYVSKSLLIQLRRFPKGNHTKYDIRGRIHYVRRKVLPIIPQSIKLVQDFLVKVAVKSSNDENFLITDFIAQNCLYCSKIFSFNVGTKTMSIRPLSLLMLIIIHIFMLRTKIFFINAIFHFIYFTYLREESTLS